MLRESLCYIAEVYAISFDLNRSQPDGYLDRVEVDPAGLVRILGWFKGDFFRAPTLLLDQEDIPFLQHYRFPRPDVVSAVRDVSVPQPGVVFEYLVDQSFVGRKFERLSVVFPNNSKKQFHGEFVFLCPHYRDLLASDHVYRRNHIYGSGLPNASVHPEVLAIAESLRGPVLDFGCGSGVVVATLLNAGTQAHGLELDTEIIRQSIPPPVKSAITLYDGTLPLDLPDRAFTSVFCSEVLEHIPDFHGAVREISRLASEQAVFTVPDMSAVPIGFRHSLVPWHLLEGTHVNFFNQQSLACVLKPFFSKIEFSRIGACSINDSRVFTSIVALCTK